MISYYELSQATNGFDESNLLGRGSFGSMFKGLLSNGMLVAVKVFNLDLELGSKNFSVECEAMLNLRHRNLMKIIGCCSSIDYKLLVMEFMPNGSLERWLYSHNHCLDFLQRLNIMINVASALEYLHHGSSPIVVYCDVKPCNVLLDEDMVGHVSDFGIAKLLGEGQSKEYTKTMATVGYIAPEFGSKGIISTKGDVYSLGIMLMETFTRKKPTDDLFVAGLSMKGWISESLSRAIDQVVDSNFLQDEGHHHVDDIIASTSSILKPALNCCEDLPEERMNMTDIAASLNKVKAKFFEASDKNVRRELEGSLEEAPKQPSLVAVPQSPATATIRIATASAQHHPCSPRIRLFFGQASASVFWPTLVLPFLANPCSALFGQPLFELLSPLFSPLRRVFEPLFRRLSATVQPLFSLRSTISVVF
ncbi:probable LRR receptor-like serine/threonine-protein kinase At3g47570 [Arachis hypogaea]|uniref:probable LRR receptor-like serine/threonine-protein kinase At3g47570 n=1 Tax=Arachis hypogaea TaxID=3818 RepID=UPI003B2238E9